MRKVWDVAWKTAVFIVVAAAIVVSLYVEFRSTSFWLSH